ncbi:hypothetical protein [Micromonospora cathayae]|uniref:Uncharacterized protein n=1 Tax=Micromonospora cathayae TaxID=3028804 RepID=A0ABY7ZLC9_9ACTN|nr:hypothetical protein [Micromonospora sp. HUAS 3]WDZ83097.1 hypothetical protein PVK37_21850 [Micromonospora sp. HUAS 3]
MRRTRALALVLVVLLTGCSEPAEPADAPAPSEGDRWACRKLQSTTLDLSEPMPGDDLAIGRAASGSPHAETRAAGDALVAAVKQAEGASPGSVAAAGAEVAIAKARQALGKACISQLGEGVW